jgi:putative ABC transport system permease protein
MLRNYLKIALRNLRSQRSYTALNGIGLTIGMTGGLLIFLFVRHHFSVDRHHDKFERIYRIVCDLHLPDGTVEYNPEAPLPMAAALSSQFTDVEQAAFLLMNRELKLSLTRPGKPVTHFVEPTGTALAGPEWFSVFSYQWLAGNAQTALSQPNAVVLTQSWATRYFGDTQPVGQRIRLNDQVDATVTGLVADPAGLTDLDIGLFVSLTTLPALKPDYSLNDWTVLNSTNRLFVVLRDGQSADRLQAALPALSRKHYGADAHFYQYQVQPLADVHFDVQRRGGVIRSSLLWSLSGVGFLLVLTACINFINLATAQAIRRSKEVGVRKTLGSSRGQLVGQFLLETGLITLGALVLAGLLTALTLPLFSSWTQTPLTFHIDSPTGLFILGLLATVILLAGSYPSAVLSGLQPLIALRGKLTGRTLGGYSLRQLLVVTQFVISQALVIGALVVAAQMRFIQQTDIGLRKENVVLVKLPTGPPSSRQAFKQQLLTYPDVQAVSTSFLPPSTEGMWGGGFRLGDRADWERFPVRERFADPDYLTTYGLRLIAGRNLTASDTIREYLVNEAFLRKLNIRDPQQILGRRMQYHASPVALPIVGVVKDFQLRSLHEEVQPCLITTKADQYGLAGIRISGQDPNQSLAHIRQAWQQFFPNEVFDAQFFDEQLAKFYTTETLIGRLVNTFALIAILIGCLGLYGLVTFVVGQRTKEIGVRKVLGASEGGLIVLLSKDFLRLVLIALVIASPLAWYFLQQWLQGFAYKTAIGWWVFALAGVVSVGVALLTVSHQSIKAARMNPVKSLRSE